MVNYLGGNIIEGSSSQASYSGFKELKRVTLSSNGDSLDTGTFDAKDNIMFLFHIQRPSSGDQNIRLRFNGDSGNNYSERYELDGGGDTTAISQPNIALHSGVVNENFGVFNFKNVASREKLCIGNVVGSNSDGAGYAPNMRDQTLKWSNTSDQVTRIELVNTSTGEFESGSELVVLGCDDDESRTTGEDFWQELKSYTQTSNGSTLPSGSYTSITGKKYLIVQAFTIPANNGFKGRLELGSGGSYDTSSNYSDRYEQDGGSWSPNSNHQYIYAYTNHDDHVQSLRMFIVNKADKEKLLLWWAQSAGSSTGAGNRPQRRYGVGKWSNTSAQIDDIRLNNQVSGGDNAAGSFIKIWGAD